MALLLLGACAEFRDTGKKLVVIGIDGMDPDMLQELVDAGKMPNFARLIRQQTFVPLGTSNPPQSPVAWTDFFTGVDPGGHAVFDFIHRDPKNYLVTGFSTTTVEQVFWPLPGKYQMPSPFAEEAEPIRRGKAFWNYLEEAGVRAAVYRMPAAFPADEETAQVTLSDMGTPDLRGSMNGDYFFYSTRTPEKLLGDEIKMQQVSVDDFHVSTRILGPPQLFIEETPDALVPLDVYLDPTEPVVLIDVDDGAERIVLEEGQLSEWVPVTFDLGLMQSASGIVRFLLRQVRPTFQLYMSPINIDPSNPITPLTSPDDDVLEELVEDVGYFYTQGLAENFNALESGALDDASFLIQTDAVTDERLELLDHALDRFEDGLLFVYFSTIDLRCHMMWRHIHPGHPARDEELAAEYADCIEAAYLRCDAALGHLWERVGEDTPLVILSDHGFSAFTREVELGTWLMEEGYLVLTEAGEQRLAEAKERQASGLPLEGSEVGTMMLASVDPDGPEGPAEAELQPTIDWSKTRAYPMGFNGLYVNEFERETEGIVTPEDKAALLEEIITRLEAWGDPGRDGRSIVKKVYRTDEIYLPKYREEGPDLVVGYEREYGASDEAATGEIYPGDAVHDNVRKWSGSHLMDPSVVPGVLLTNLEVAPDDPGLCDVTATILDYFGVDLDGLEDEEGDPVELRGRSILRR